MPDTTPKIVFPIDRPDRDTVWSLIAPWAERCCIEGMSRERFFQAVNETIEAVGELAAATGVRGELSVAVRPTAGSLTTDIAFPAAVPLDPRFDSEDPLLAEVPGLRLLPDVFWLSLVRHWIDQAAFRTDGKRSVVSLTQYRRVLSQDCQSLAMDFTPAPVQGFTLKRGQASLALIRNSQTACRLSPEMASILEAADGRTTLLEIHATHEASHGPTPHASITDAALALVERGLISAGNSLLPKKKGLAGALSRLCGGVFGGRE